MTTRQRIELLARAYPRLFPRAELLRLVRQQLGDIDALDQWIMRDGTRVRARAPKAIYHVCSGNLAVSAWTSIAHGLILGARNVVKLPSNREDSTARREIIDFIRGLPAPLRKLVETQTGSAVQLPQQGRSRVQHGSEILQEADAVIAFGSDETMSKFRAQIRPGQRFIAHGHALSLLWLEEPNDVTPRQARACAVDVLTYDQLGCLSPQAIYFPPGAEIEELGPKLAQALDAEWQEIEKKPARPLAVAAKVAEARDVAHALGHRVWLPPKNHLGWTLIHDPEPAFQPSPLHGVIYLREARESQLRTALGSVAGRISTVGVAGHLNSRLENVFISLGVTRFCPAGRMQFPPLTWHHDGRPPLADLVTWVDFEGWA